MKRVAMHDAKANLSRYVSNCKPGETMILCNRNEPVAELRSLSRKPKLTPRLGAFEGQFTIQHSFFDTMLEERLRSFQGEE